MIIANPAGPIIENLGGHSSLLSLTVYPVLKIVVLYT